MIPEREREALMRLTMCAREECRMCMYQKRCDFNFQCELATKNMNILAEALRKTEPTISKMEQVDKDINVRSKDEPQSGYCNECKWYGDKQVCGRCRSRNLYAPKDEPSDSEKSNNCEYAENPSGDVWECGCFLDTYCEHQIYDRNPDGTINIVECGYKPKDEPQTDYTPDCPFCKRYGTEDCLGSDCRHYKTYKTEPQTERSSE